MRSAIKTAAILATTHASVFLAIVNFQILEWAAGFAGFSIYLPIAIFGWLGLPVFRDAGGWGWSSPSGLGTVFILFFWIAVWLCMGHALALVARAAPSPILQPSIVAERGFVVNAYRDTAEGALAKDECNSMTMKTVTLRLWTRFAGSTAPTEGTLAELHPEAHTASFIANSVKTEIRCGPTMSTMP